MRILLWNSNGGIKQKDKLEYFRSFEPDIAILPEIREGHMSALGGSQAIWATNNHKVKDPKGLGVVAFKETKLQELEKDSEMEIYLPLKVVHPELTFNLLAVWNFYSTYKRGRYKGDRKMDILEILSHYNSMYKEPCLVGGDWNAGATLKGRDGFFKIANRLQEFGFTSLYHSHHQKPIETQDYVTYRHTSGKQHGIDHLFGNSYFAERVSAFVVSDFSSVVKSDHVPVVVDFNLNGVK